MKTYTLLGFKVKRTSENGLRITLNLENKMQRVAFDKDDILVGDSVIFDFLENGGKDLSDFDVDFDDMATKS